MLNLRRTCRRLADVIRSSSRLDTELEIKATGSTREILFIERRLVRVLPKYLLLTGPLDEESFDDYGFDSLV